MENLKLYLKKLILILSQILLAGELFAFNKDPEIVGRDLVYTFDEDSRYIEEEGSTELTLIVIKNSANNSIADEIRKLYF